MIDILIKNGTLIEGTGKAARKADVAIEKGKIAEIAENIDAKAAQTINARDKFVTPGFIDIQNHSDSYWTLFDQPQQTSMVSQGVTSIVVGNCGASLAPLLSPESIKSIQKWHSLGGVNINWVSLAEFLQVLSRMPLGVNVATLVGHATLKRGILKDNVRELSADEIKTLAKAASDALAEGAAGTSLGLIYAHEVNSSLTELFELVKTLKPANKYLSVHLRSEASHALDSLDEAFELASKADVPLKISHLKIRGKKNWHLFDQMISKLELAYHRGVKVSFDVYPYDTSWSVLYTYLPKWAYEGGREKILSTLSDKISRRKILDYLREQGHDSSKIIIATAEGATNFVGKTIKQIASNQNVSDEEALLNVLAASKVQAVAFDHNLSDEQVEILMASPFSMIGSDGAGFSSGYSGLIHPRCFGTFPKFLKWVREKKTIKWEEAVQKITSEPAKLLHLTNRGIISKNYQADIVIFDPQTITDRADYQYPNRTSEGVDMVLVNGKLCFANKQMLNLNGTVIK